jgi:hypothetical protein
VVYKVSNHRYTRARRKKTGAYAEDELTQRHDHMSSQVAWSVSIFGLIILGIVAAFRGALTISFDYFFIAALALMTIRSGFYLILERTGASNAGINDED